MMNLCTIKRALISVSDKTGIGEFAKTLEGFGVEIISTGGTLEALRAAGIRARSVSELTGFPEILDGRVKTLHPAIHAGLLAVSGDARHAVQLSEHKIDPIDMVVVNLYPFEETIAKGSVELDEAIEQIDIGGPSMIRAAAKNFRYKTVVACPSRYAAVSTELERNHGAISEETRFQLAREAFLHTARYDAVISGYLESVGQAPSALPAMLTLALPKAQDLRYGENPHQHAALYGTFNEIFEKMHGKDLSYNNIVDLQAGAELAEEFSEPAVAIVKHTNPCGVGVAATLADAYEKALATDPKSAFGGIVAMNRPLDMETAKRIDRIFTEVIVAPAYDEGVLDLLRRKKDRRLIR